MNDQPPPFYRGLSNHCLPYVLLPFRSTFGPTLVEYLPLHRTSLYLVPLPPIFEVFSKYGLFLRPCLSEAPHQPKLTMSWTMLFLLRWFHLWPLGFCKCLLYVYLVSLCDRTLTETCLFFLFELQSKCKNYPTREKGAVLVVWESLLALSLFRLCHQTKPSHWRIQNRQTHSNGMEYMKLNCNIHRHKLYIYCSLQNRFGSFTLWACLFCWLWENHSGYVLYNMLQCPGVYTTYSFMFYYF